VNVLITHECSGVVREAFRALGHCAWSCDLKEAEDKSPFHQVGDAIQVMRRGILGDDHGWDIIIMHPPCTYLNSAGLHWNNRGRGHEKTETALQHVLECMHAATMEAWVGWALENPAGRIGTAIRKWDQAVQPYEFGDDASKTTGLWLLNLPRLVKDTAQYIPPRWVCKKCGHVALDEQAKYWVNQEGFVLCNRCPGTPKRLPRWGNQTDSGQNKLAPGPTRAADRARTYAGIARAMAAQWGALK